jgi:hypothetical protein
MSKIKTNEKCDHMGEWSVYDGDPVLPDNAGEGSEFYFLGSCDECGQILKINCCIDRIEIDQERGNGFAEDED